MSIIIDTMMQVGVGMWVGLLFSATVLFVANKAIKKNSDDIAAERKERQDIASNVNSGFLKMHGELAEMNTTIRMFATGEISTTDGQVTKLKNGNQDKEIADIRKLAEETRGELVDMKCKLKAIEVSIAGNDGLINSALDKQEIYSGLSKE